MSRSRRARWGVPLAAVLATCTLPAATVQAAPTARFAPVAVNASDAIVRQITIALQQKQWETADNLLRQLKNLADDAVELAGRSPTQKNRDAADAAQRLYEQQRRRVVDAKIAHALRQPREDPNDPDNLQPAQDYWEATVASWIGPLVLQFDQKFGTNGRVGQVDIETERAIIEVHFGNQAKRSQILGEGRQWGLINHPVLNPSSKTVIFFRVPNPNSRGPELSHDSKEAYRRAGVPIVSDLNALIGALRDLGEAVGNIPGPGASKAAKRAAEQARSAFGSPGQDKAPTSGLTQSLTTAANGGNGGIDFRSLELRHLSEKPGNDVGSIGYSFTGVAAETYSDQHVEDAAKAVGQASDSFFVWLAMPRDSFWVNLNPNEPNRIVDVRLGTTEVGRVLLEADLEMKRTIGRLIHPETKAGLRFWDEMGVNACFSFRNWIVARPATVYDSGDELYIVDAPLEALSESHYLKGQGVGGSKGCKLSEAEEQRLEKVYAKRILPKLNKAINTGPEYAELRRVYLSRVAAEWYRQRTEKGHVTAYGSLIDSGDVSRWRYRGKWRPRDTYNDFLESHRKGEFKIKKTWVKGGMKYTRTFLYGGVDWGSVILRRVNAAELERTAPGVAAQVKRSIGGQAAEPGGKRVWVGGSVPVRLAGRAPQQQTGLPLGVYLGILIATVVGVGTIIVRARRGLRPPSRR